MLSLYLWLSIYYIKVFKYAIYMCMYKYSNMRYIPWWIFTNKNTSKSPPPRSRYRLLTAVFHQFPPPSPNEPYCDLFIPVEQSPDLGHCVSETTQFVCFCVRLLFFSTMSVRFIYIVARSQSLSSFSLVFNTLFSSLFIHCSISWLHCFWIGARCY